MLATALLLAVAISAPAAASDEKSTIATLQLKPIVAEIADTRKLC